MDAILSIFHGPGLYAALFVLLLLCGVGNPIPEDLVLMTAGYLAFSGQVKLVPMLIVCYVGVICGDLLLYQLGYHYGQKIIDHPRLMRLAPPARVARIRHNFERWGKWSIGLARFLPGLRAPTFLMSGVMRIRFRTFTLLDGIGGLFSVPLFVGLGFVFGGNLDGLRHDIRHISHWIMAGGVVAILCFLAWLWLRSRSVTVE